MHEARYGLRNKDVLSRASKNHLVEHVEMLAAEICWNELASANCRNVKQLDERDLSCMLGLEPNAREASVIETAVSGVLR